MEILVAALAVTSIFGILAHYLAVTDTPIDDDVQAAINELNRRVDRYYDTGVDDGLTDDQNKPNDNPTGEDK
jgi:hypothetical protein